MRTAILVFRASTSLQAAPAAQPERSAAGGRRTSRGERVTSSSVAPYWVSSVDMISLMALILTLFGELILLVFSLWLLFRATLAPPRRLLPCETVQASAK